MKQSLLSVAALAAALTAARADLHLSFNYDSVPSGSNASLFDSYPLTTSYAVFAADVDEFGSDIPGTERWRADITAPPVTVDDPTPFGAPAFSPSNALNAKFQPVILDFSVVLTDLNFSVRLDGDTFGDQIAEILFLNASGAVVQTLAIDQTQPYAGASINDVDGVSSIVLPGGAFYDNLGVDAVPEPGTYAAIAAAGLMLGWQGWRRRLSSVA